MGLTWAINTAQCQPTTPTDLLVGALTGSLNSLAGPLWRWGKGLFGAKPTTPPLRFGPGAAHASDPAFNGGDAASRGDSVFLYKAPQRGLGAHQEANGYRAEDFPGDPHDPYAEEDGRAYFGLGDDGQKVAEKYADAYGEGVVRIRIPAADYEKYFRKHQYNYQGGPVQEVAIPNYDVEKCAAS